MQLLSQSDKTAWIIPTIVQNNIYVSQNHLPSTEFRRAVVSGPPCVGSCQVSVQNEHLTDIASTPLCAASIHLESKQTDFTSRLKFVSIFKHYRADN